MRGKLFALYIELEIPFWAYVAGGMAAVGTAVAVLVLLKPWSRRQDD